VKDCQLSDHQTLPNGFAFAMQCKGTKTILTFRFAKDMVSGTIQNTDSWTRRNILLDPHHDAAGRRLSGAAVGQAAVAVSEFLQHQAKPDSHPAHAERRHHLIVIPCQAPDRT